MTEETIQKKFKIQRDTPKTLTEQLKERISAFIDQMPDNSRLPSERELSETLHITRVTVHNALRPFLENGSLVSRKRHGIFTVKKNRLIRHLDALPQSYLESFFIGRSSTTLKILLNEKLEILQNFWQDAVREFNRTDSGVSVEIEWLPSYIVQEREIQSYAETKSADLVQRHLSKVGHDYSYLRDLDGLLAPIPEEDNELPLLLQPSSGTRTMAPVYFCLWSAMWNDTFRRNCGIPDVEEFIVSGRSDEILLKAASQLPPDVTVAGNFWNYFLLPGVPLEKEAYTPDFFRERFERLLPLTKHPDMFIRRERHPLEALHLLADGTGMFYFGLAHFMLASREREHHALRTTFFPHHPGLALPWVSSYLGILKQSRNQEDAAAFIRYMQSPPLQEKLVAVTGLTSPRRSVNDTFRKTLSHPAAENHRSSLKHLTAMDDCITIILGTQKSCKDIFLEFYTGKASPRQAAEKIYRRLLTE